MRMVDGSGLGWYIRAQQGESGPQTKTIEERRSLANASPQIGESRRARTDLLWDDGRRRWLLCVWRALSAVCGVICGIVE